MCGLFLSTVDGNNVSPCKVDVRYLDGRFQFLHDFRGWLSQCWACGTKEDVREIVTVCCLNYGEPWT